MGSTLYRFLLYLTSSVITRLSTRGPPDINSLVPVGPKYTLKWSAPLLHTQVMEVGQDSQQSVDRVGTDRRHSSTSSTIGTSSVT